MSNLTKGIPPQPYGQGGRKVVLPVKATTQVYQGGMGVESSAGAMMPATASGGGLSVAGVFESDALGGSSDGSIRVTLMTDRIFLFANGTNACADTTPFGTQLYAEDDHTVGTGGIGGAAECKAGKFMGFEDDGRVRVFIGGPEALEQYMFVNGVSTSLTGAGFTATVTAQGRFTRYAATSFSATPTVTLSTTGAVVGDVIRITRDASATTLAIIDGGTGTPTLCTLVTTKVGWAQAYFNGTNWIYDGSSGT